MLRYLGPKLKKLKQLNIHIQPAFSTKYFIKKKMLRNNKAIISFFLLELLEKQKLKFTFSLSEKIIKKYILFLQKHYYKKFRLIDILEMRLDYILFTLGYSITIIQARQLIVHGHFFVNFILVKNPGFLVKKGDIINLSPRSIFVFSQCKKYIYYKYITNRLAFKNILLCLKTLLFIVYPAVKLQYTFINYDCSLIGHYYVR